MIMNGLKQTGSRPRLNTQIQVFEPAQFAGFLIFRDITRITGSGISVQNVAVRVEERIQGQQQKDGVSLSPLFTKASSLQKP